MIIHTVTLFLTLFLTSSEPKVTIPAHFFLQNLIFTGTPNLPSSQCSIARRGLPDEGSGDGEDRADEPGRVGDDQTLEVLP